MRNTIKAKVGYEVRRLKSSPMQFGFTTETSSYSKERFERTKITSTNA